MATTRGTHILFCTDAAPEGDEVSRSLEEAGYFVLRHELGPNLPDPSLRCDLTILDGGQRTLEAADFCRRLRARTARGFVPLLWLASNGSRQQGLEAGADACLQKPFGAGELLAQVQASLRIKCLHDKLSEESAEFHRVNNRLQLAYQQIDQELELACRIQQSMLPQKLPELPTVRFAVHYRPCNRVGGDFYDLFRLDEHHLGLYIADVMGHGVPASLLTIFLKKAVIPKEISGHSYTLLKPDEVLSRLNRELIDQNLAETPFITMIYALLNVQERTISFARAGHPYPLYVPRVGEPTSWQEHGTLLGIFDTTFTVRTETLAPGDKLLLYTDGLEAPSKSQETSEQVLKPCVERYRHLPITELVDRVAQDLFRTTDQPDDFTLLGLEILS